MVSRSPDPVEPAAGEEPQQARRRGPRALFALGIALALAFLVAILLMWMTPTKPANERLREQCEARGGEWVAQPNTRPFCSLR